MRKWFVALFFRLIRPHIYIEGGPKLRTMLFGIPVGRVEVSDDSVTFITSNSLLARIAKFYFNLKK